MKIAKLILLTFLIHCYIPNIAQNSKGIEIPKEKIFVHYNASLLLTGEYMFYKIYCLDPLTNKTSNYSKIAYVELIGEDHSRVFKHQINLTNGMGYADFFVPTDISSGNYKMIAYTQWMRNFKPISYFEADITIINPYRTDQSSLLLENEHGYVMGPFTDSLVERVMFRNTGMIPFELSLNKSVFAAREAVELELYNRIRENGIGSYSISVRKVDDLPAHQILSTKMFEQNKSEEFDRSGLVRSSAIKFVPEREGSFINGRVISVQTNEPMANQNVALSVPGTNFIFKVTKTDNSGKFQFELEPHIENNEGVFVLMNKNANNGKIELIQTESMDYSKLSFAQYGIAPSMKNAIEKRSVYNQIENGYFSIKQDTVTIKIPARPFTYFEKWITYDLDDFTRFTTMDEVFTEIIKLVWTEKNDAGQIVVRVFHRDFSPETGNIPLIFIDGMFVPDHGEVLELNAMTIKNIHVCQNSYQFGDHDYQGVIRIETIDGNYMKNVSSVNKLNFVLPKPEPRKSYFKQTYKDQYSENYIRIPDYRNQLYWEPNAQIKSSRTKFNFFTSDNPGIYEIRFEGYTKNGLPISLWKQFEVVSKVAN